MYLRAHTERIKCGTDVGRMPRIVIPSFIN
jgi:hypothetical protein